MTPPEIKHLECAASAGRAAAACIQLCVSGTLGLALGSLSHSFILRGQGNERLLPVAVHGKSWPCPVA